MTTWLDRLKALHPPPGGFVRTRPSAPEPGGWPADATAAEYVARAGGLALAELIDLLGLDGARLAAEAGFTAPQGRGGPAYAAVNAHVTANWPDECNRRDVEAGDALRRVAATAILAAFETEAPAPATTRALWLWSWPWGFDVHGDWPEADVRAAFERFAEAARAEGFDARLVERTRCIPTFRGKSNPHWAPPERPRMQRLDVDQIGPVYLPNGSPRRT